MVNYTSEDLLDHHAVGAVIYDREGRVLMQDHVKFGFWTIPIGKAKDGQSPVDGIKEEVFEGCNLEVVELKEIACDEKDYERDGRLVHVVAHVYEVLEYKGEMKNLEADKHRVQRFMSIDEIMELPYLSDNTILFLKSIGKNREAKI